MNKEAGIGWKAWLVTFASFFIYIYVRENEEKSIDEEARKMLFICVSIIIIIIIIIIITITIITVFFISPELCRAELSLVTQIQTLSSLCLRRQSLNLHHSQSTFIK